MFEGDRLLEAEAEVGAVAAALAGAPVVALDVEFVAGKRFAAQLCVVQLAWQGPDGAVALALLDAVRVPAATLRAALAPLADPDRLVVAHAARQDVEILAAAGIGIGALFDTQVAAALLGGGDQVGLAALLATQLGLAHDKGPQWTDWARRPLAPEQLRYAAADVRHLLALHARQHGELVRRGRAGWLVEESAAVLRDGQAAAMHTDADAWRALPARGLDGAATAAMIALAGWRIQAARVRDVPTTHVLADKLLLDLARLRPRTERALRDVRGMTADVRAASAELLEAIASAPAVATPAAAPLAPLSPRASVWAEVILALVADAARRAEVPARLLAARASAEALARLVDDGGVAAARAAAHPLTRTWRDELCGAAVLAWLDGRAALRADPAAPGGLRLEASS